MKESLPEEHGWLAVATRVGGLGVLALLGYCIGFFGPEWFHPTNHAPTVASVTYDAARLMGRMWITGPAGALGFLFVAMIVVAISRRFVRR
jgi:hypothetical protein